MVFDMLVYAFHNESIMEVSQVFQKILCLSEQAIKDFSDYILTDSSSEFIRILMKCSEGLVRDSVSNILSTAANRMFDKVDLIEKAEKFMNNIINAVHTQASNNWTKFEQFFNLIKQVTIGGDAQLDFMKKNQMETVLADFFLADRSPIRPPDEKRMSMGNNYSKPTYDSLVQCICYLSRHTDPREPGVEIGLPPTTMGKKAYPPGEKEKKVIVCKPFAQKAIKEAFEADAVGKLIAHWSYENEENSKIYASVFLKGVNETEFEEVAPFLTAMHHFLGINDSLQHKRLEWLLGVPMLVDGAVSKNKLGHVPRLGIFAIQCLSDEAFYFPSTLEGVESSNESILSIIWRSKRRFENYTIVCIKELLNLGEATMRYVNKMPSPSYQYARYTDWLFQFCEEKQKSKAKDAENYRDVTNHVMKMLEKYSIASKEYEEELKLEHAKIYNLTPQELEYSDEQDMEEDTPQEDTTEPKSENIRNILEKDDKESEDGTEFKAFPRPYLVGKVINENQVIIDEKNDIQLIISELECEWAWSKPLGKNQSTKKFFDYCSGQGSLKKWNKPIKKPEDFTHKTTEAFVELGSKHDFEKKHDLEAGKQDEHEPSNIINLLPIDEYDESKQDDDDNWGHVSDKDQQMDAPPQKPEYGESDIDLEKFKNLKLNLTGTMIKVGDMHCNPEMGCFQSINEDTYEMKPDYIKDFIDNLPKEKVSQFLKAKQEDIPELIPGGGEIPTASTHQQEYRHDQEIEINERIDKFQRTEVVVLRIAVHNTTNKKVKVEVEINSEDGAPNFFVPLCSIKAEICSKQFKTLAYFHKLHLGRPFGLYSYKFTTDQEPVVQEAKAEQSTTVDQGSNAYSGWDDTPNITVGPDDMDAMQNEINCEVCTLFNPISNTKCSICGAVLPHRK